jgi:hypothetical protein
MTEYKIITSVYKIPLNSHNISYPHIPKRIRFYEYVDCYIYDYKPRQFSTVQYCIRTLSKILGLKYR